MKTKEFIRSTMLQQRAAFDESSRFNANRLICRQLTELIAFNKFKTVHAFIPMGKEVDITPVIQFCLESRIKVVCPKTLKKPELKHLTLTSLEDIELGVFGTQYPGGENEFSGTIDVIIVPGLAFDHEGGRLGYGGGYYDHFLSANPDALKVGVAYDFQLIDYVPTQCHDVRIDKVIVG